MRDFQPDWASPPGDTIKDVLRERGLVIDDLAARTGLPSGFLRLLTEGEAVISDDTAIQLERVLGSSADFWLRREAQFRASLARQVAKVASEALGRGLTMETVATRADLPAPYVAKVFEGAAYYAPWVVERLRRSVSKSEAEFEASAELLRTAFAGVQVKALFRENWTEQDHANERAHQANVHATKLRRESAMLERGWKLFSQRRHLKGQCAMRQWAIDPLNGNELVAEDAYRLQEQREPGSIERWPTRDFTLPSGGVMFDLPEKVEVRPLSLPSAGIFYAEFCAEKIRQGE